MFFFFFFSSRRRHTRSLRDWSSDVCSSDLAPSSAGRESTTLSSSAWQKGQRTTSRYRRSLSGPANGLTGLERDSVVGCTHLVDHGPRIIARSQTFSDRPQRVARLDDDQAVGDGSSRGGRA